MNLLEKIHGSRQADHSHSHPAPFWVRFYDPIVQFASLGRAKKLHQASLMLAKIQPGESLLDMGCGTGMLILEAEKIIGPTGAVVGLDVELEMIAQARRKAAKAKSRAAFEVASIEHIPYPEASFDVAISSAVIHHLTQAQIEQGLVELYRVLKPKGRLLVVDLDLSRRSLASRLPGHRRLAKQDHVRNQVPGWLQTAGFSNIKTGKHPFKQLSYAIGEKP